MEKIEMRESKMVVTFMGMKDYLQQAGVGNQICDFFFLEDIGLSECR